MLAQQPYLSFCNIGKRFPGVQALKDITFDCYSGQVHALVGENGAGKSTLLKILSGGHLPSEGQLKIEGKPVQFNSTVDALKAGVAIIYQELHVVPEMTIAENIKLGQLPHRGGILNKKQLKKEAKKQLNYLGLDFNPDTPLKYLSLAQRQMVEIAKALSRNAEIIAFDEPTSSLSSREIRQLFKVINDLRDKGKVIIYVSHRMEEIFELSNQITVFKDGKYVKTFTNMDEVNNDVLVHSMVGRDIGDIYNYKPRKLGDVCLELKEFKAPNVAHPISLTVKKGEIVGLFGLVGAGRSELMKGIFGGTKATSGQMFVNGKELKIKSPIDGIRNGILLCPEDRKAEGIIAIHNIQENINISARRNHLTAKCLIQKKWEKENALKKIQELNVRTPSANQLIMNLSGGNQQKAILGRWLSESMNVILLDEPTRGIDVGAKSEIYNIIYNLAEQGIAVLFASSDLPEVIGLSDRILVMRDGNISGEVLHDDATETSILAIAMLNTHAA